MAPTALIFCTVLLDLIGFGIVLPLLPSYAAQFHAGETEIGILVASFSLMQFLLAHWWGKLSDRVGRRPVLLVGLAGSSLSYLLFAFAGNLWLLLLSRLVAGAMGATVNVAQAYLADITTPETRPRAMGLLGAAFGLGFVIGPGLGGVTSTISEHAPGLVASGLTALNFILAWWWLPESRHGTEAPKETAPFAWQHFAGPFAATACTTVAYTVLYVIFPLEVERTLGFTRHQSSYLFVLLGLVAVVVQGGLIGKLVARFGERRLIRVGSLLMGVGLLCLPLAFRAGGSTAGLLLLYSGLLVTATGSSMVGPSAATLTSRLASEGEQGRALGMLQSVGAMARIGGPIMAGSVAAGFGSWVAFAVASATAGIAGIVGLAGTD